MSIAETGRFWEILVIPVLQILEDLISDVSTSTNISKTNNRLPHSLTEHNKARPLRLEECSG
jgi:hypothetical protein